MLYNGWIRLVLQGESAYMAAGLYDIVDGTLSEFEMSKGKTEIYEIEDE